METVFINYMFVSGISLIVLYSIYHLFLRKDTLFEVNRIYLIACILFSLILPFITINITIHQPITQGEIGGLFAQEIITEEAGSGQTINWISIAAIVYIIGVVFMISRLLISLIAILKYIIQHKSIKLNNHKIFLINNNSTHFTFFNLIFINSKDIDENNFDAIFSHESEHINRKHFIDLMLLEVLIVFQWFNPIVWLYNKSLRSIHEFEADNKVVSKNICNKATYLNILYNQVSKTNLDSLINTFNNSLTKTRIIMITRDKTSKRSAFKLLFAVPVTLMLLAVFSINYVYSSPADEAFFAEEEQIILQNDGENLSLTSIDEIPEVIIPETEIVKPQIAESDTTVYLLVDETPKFPGGDAARLQFLRDNVKYPPESKANNVSGNAYCQFIVEADGSVSNVKILRGLDEYIDAEVLRVMSLMPKWIPGKQNGKPVRVQFSMRMKFKLDKTNE